MNLVEVVDCWPLSKPKLQKKKLTHCKLKILSKIVKRVRFNVKKKSKQTKKIKRLTRLSARPLVKRERKPKNRAKNSHLVSHDDSVLESEGGIISWGSADLNCSDAAAHPPSESEGMDCPSDVNNFSPHHFWNADHSYEDEFIKSNRIRCFYAKDGKCLLSMTPGTVIGLRGKVGMKVLDGCVHVLGFCVDQRKGIVPIYSSASSYAITIRAQLQEDYDIDSEWDLDQFLLDPGTRAELQTLKQERNLVFVCFQQLNDVTNRILLHYFPKLYQPKSSDDVVAFKSEAKFQELSFVNPGKRSALRIPDVWYEVVDQLKCDFSGEGNNMRILVCGGKGAGKSTLSRFLMNSFLSCCENVCLLDCDPGQSECTLPGCISLVKIKQALLGPPYTHNQQALKSCFVGGVNVSPYPSLYIESVKLLFDLYEEKKSTIQSPLFINTMGWTSGLGLSLFIDIICITKPTHILQLSMGSSLVWNFHELTSEYIMQNDGWLFSPCEVGHFNHRLIFIEAIRSEKQKIYNSAILRDLNLLAYFSQLENQHLDRFFSLNFYTPYKVPWSAIAVNVSHEKLPLHQILYALNGSLVALGNCDQSLFQNSTDETLPKFLLDLTACECVGYGIVRGINMEEKMIYLITPVDLFELSKVNVLMKGAVRIPEQLILDQKIDGNIPYTAKVSEMKSTIGGKSVSGRSFRERSSQVYATAKSNND